MGRALLGGAMLGIEVDDGVDQSDMRESLGEIADEALFLEMIFLGEQADVVLKRQ